MPIKINGTNTAANPSITGDDTDTGIVYGSDQIDFSTGGSSKVTLNGSNLGIGVANPTTSLHVQQSAVTNAPSRLSALYLENNANCEIQFVGNSSNDCQLRFGTSSNSFLGAIEYELDNNNLEFYTNGSERMRINSAGHVLVATTTENVNSSSFGIVLDSNGSGHFFRNVDGGHNTFRSGGTQGLAVIRGDGDLQNTNNSYGQVSDETLKQDIVDAASQWNDIKNLKVRKFRFKDNPTGVLQIGVIAQETEQVSAGLVQEDSEGIKSVKYSVLYMKAVKALQEAIAKIETLETKVAALEAA